MPTPLPEPLVTGRVRGDPTIHLFSGTGGTSLCGLDERLTGSSLPFRTRPCGGCLAAALRDGHLTALERSNVFVNLRRVTAATGPVMAPPRALEPARAAAHPPTPSPLAPATGPAPRTLLAAVAPIAVPRKA